ncbi:MAG TPA: hypothetical protein VIH36_07100 [Casimicrobiaceae bacterium]
MLDRDPNARDVSILETSSLRSKESRVSDRDAAPHDTPERALLVLARAV